MIDIKYKNKKYLAKYDLFMGLFEAFDLKVEDVIPVRKVFFVKTNKGDKILKKIEYSLEDLNFIYAAMSYIRGTFPRVFNFVQTKSNEPYTIWNQDIYCMMDLVEGRECEFANPIDLQIASIGVGELHNASEGFRYNRNSRYLAGNLIHSFMRKKEELQFFANIANLHEQKSEFDEIFLSNVQCHIEEVERSIQLLEKSPYYKLCSEEQRVVLCHHDLAHHNILIKDEKAYFVDFDYSVIDLKIHDLCNFINRAIKNAGFDIDKAKLIVESYCKSNTLDGKEMEVLGAMLSFPEDFYSISRDYYARRKDWEEEVFLDRLVKKVQFREDRIEFLNEFYKL